MISTAHGLKFTDFKRSYHARPARTASSRDSPTRRSRCPRGYEDVRSEIFRQIDLRFGS